MIASSFAFSSCHHRRVQNWDGDSGVRTHGQEALRVSVGEAHAGRPNSIDTARPNSPGAMVGGIDGAAVGATVLGGAVGAIVLGARDVGAWVVGGNDGALDCARTTAAMHATSAIVIVGVHAWPMMT